MRLPHDGVTNAFGPSEHLGGPGEERLDHLGHGEWVGDEADDAHERGVVSCRSGGRECFLGQRTATLQRASVGEFGTEGGKRAPGRGCR